MLTACLMLALAASASAPSKERPCTTLFEGSLAPKEARAAWVSPALAAVSPTRVFVAWEASSELQVRARVTGEWVKLPSPAKGEAWDPVLAIAEGGNPVAAWRAETDGQSRLHLARWDGAQWVALGDGPRSLRAREGSPLQASLRRTHDGALHLAFQQQDGGVQVARWSGTAWEALGEPLDAVESRAAEPSLCFDEANRPWATWIGGSEAAPRLRVARWSGKKWERLHDQSAPSGAGLSSPKLESAGSAWLVLSWVEFADRSAPTESRLGVARWAGDRFDPMVGPPATAGGKGPQRLAAIATGEDSLAIAWTELDRSRVSKVYAWQLRGGEWSPALSGLHADPNPANAQDVSLAAVPGGFLALWDEPGGRLERLHVAHVSSCAARPEQPKAAAEAGWPKTVDVAADRFLARMDDAGRQQLKKLKKADLARFHHAHGSDIRSDLGLFKGNAALLEACGGAEEECSMKIVVRAWEKLQAKMGGFGR